MRLKKIFIGLLALAGCTPQELSNDSVGYDTYALYDRYIDEQGNQGIVAYKYKDDEDGYQVVLVLSADETDASWGPEDRNLIPFNQSANIGYANNTSYAIDMNHAVEMQGVSHYPAFAWCQAKNPPGERIHASSWILPSLRMMQRILNNKKDAVNQALSKYGMTPLNDEDCYWTCTEDIEGYFSFADETVTSQYDYDPVARAIPLTSDNEYYIRKTIWQKENVHHVRAVKMIHYKSSISEDN